MNSPDRFRHFDVREDDPEESRLHRWLPAAGALALVLVLGGAGAFLIDRMSGTAAPQQPLVQQVSLVLPPPPPPPPKMEEPEPEPEPVELDEPEPEPLADDSAEPPGGELGLDAEGVAGGDAFGLQARKGGRGLLGGGDAFAWYAGVIQRDLQTHLSNDEDIRDLGDYAVIVSIYLGEDGVIRASELVSGSNSPDLDSALRRALAAGIRVSREPPDDLPQPIRLRITSRS